MIKVKQTVLLLGDIVFLYASLFLMIAVRYHTITPYLIQAHLGPFSAVFFLWIVALYGVGLYNIRSIKNTFRIIEEALGAVVAGVVLSIVAFYAVPYFHISPKRNLLIFALLFLIAVVMWRFLFFRIVKTPQKKVLFIGSGNDIDEVYLYLSENKHLGYTPLESESSLKKDYALMCDRYHPDIIVVDAALKNITSVAKTLYQQLPRGVEIMDSVSAHEFFLQKIPLLAIEHLWIALNISRSKKLYEIIKRPVECVCALILLLASSPLIAVSWLLIRLSSPGGGWYTQLRVGKNQKMFRVYKLRTMRQDADRFGPAWTEQNDSRITPVGALLRRTHIDELPQLINIIKGDLSFVGPRPESISIVESLRKDIPFYDVRHLIKPGVTGWAQIHYPPSASAQEVYTKLEYDMYYLKHASPLLDVLIILQTIRLFFMEL